MTCDLASRTPESCINYVLQQEEEPDTSDAPVALLTSGANTLSAEKVFIVVKGDVVLRDLPRLADSSILLLFCPLLNLWQNCFFPLQKES